MKFTVGSRVGIIMPSLLNYTIGGPFTVMEQTDFDTYRLDNGLTIGEGLLAPWAEIGAPTRFLPLTAGRFSIGQEVCYADIPNSPTFRVVYGPCLVFGMIMYQLNGVPAITEAALRPC